MVSYPTTHTGESAPTMSLSLKPQPLNLSQLHHELSLPLLGASNQSSGANSRTLQDSDITKMVDKLPLLTWPHIKKLSECVRANTGKTLAEDLLLRNWHTCWHKYLMHACIVGPIKHEVETINTAIEDKKFEVLGELLLRHSNHSTKTLEETYQEKHGITIIEHVKRKAPAGLAYLIQLALEGCRSSQSEGHGGHLVDNDVYALFRQANKENTEKRDVYALSWWQANKENTETNRFLCQFFMQRSYENIAAVIERFKELIGTDLRDTIRSAALHDGVKAGLLYIIDSADGLKYNKQYPGAWRDAGLMEDAMKGIGTRDWKLCYRIIRASWDCEEMRAIREAYLKRYGETLEKRVQGDTNLPHEKSYQSLLCQLISKD